jgi:hypothetical protein
VFSKLFVKVAVTGAIQAKHDSPNAKVDATIVATKALDVKVPEEALGSDFAAGVKMSFFKPGGVSKVTAPTVPVF